VHGEIAECSRSRWQRWRVTWGNRDGAI